MQSRSGALLPFLALLAVVPVLIPTGSPPVVTAPAELAVGFIAGSIAMVLGARAWAEAPLQVAAFPTVDQRTSPWPHLLVLTAALAGLLCAFIGILQVLAPQALQGPLGALIQPSHSEGRAVGHMRQPNHLATILLWGSVAWAVVHEQFRLRPLIAWAGMVLLTVAVVFTGSRTGLLGLAFLLAWALVDRQLSSGTRQLLMAAPLIATATWLLLRLWNAQTTADLGNTSRLLGGGGDVSSARFAIWANTWTLIQEQPWLGVGWGRFNIAWTLTPLSDRPLDFFGHPHNLPLHLVVELGLPLGLACCAGLAAMLLVAARRAWGMDHASGQAGPALDAPHRRAAVVMLGIVGWHSLLEYPLWYFYLSAPAALAWVVAMGWDRPWVRAARWQALLLMVGGGATLLCSVWATYDYHRISSIYAPGPKAPPLTQRIEQGQSARWFAHQAHYAHATTFKPVPGQAWDATTARAFERAPRVLLDARLMMAWADALAARNEAGDRDQARYLAARLRDLHHPSAQTWLQACEDARTPPHRRFVCEAPEQPWTWRDFEAR